MLVFIVSVPFAQSEDISKKWEQEWPRTDFSKSIVDFKSIISGGPPKDGIPAIDNPRFKPVSDIQDLGDKEPVIALELNGIAKAYPLRILIWHEIVNDQIGDLPITVTYCPLCNASVVFDRRLDGNVLDFGVSGKLRHSDMIMYDRQSESWWQQFTGLGIVGEMTGKSLNMIPSETIPFAAFKERYPDGKVLVPNTALARRYGQTPYRGYDTSKWPFLYKGDYDGPVSALAYVVAVGQNAWPLSLIREHGTSKQGDLVFTWEGGMASALDQSSLAQGRDIGFVSVKRENPDGSFSKVVHDVTFAFAFKAFYPDGIIHTE